MEKKAGSSEKKSASAAKVQTARSEHKTGKSTHSVNLALQGGGAHGAFTWGVLDRFLEREDIVIDSISGTSAGAMNGAVMTDGYNRGGRDGGREQLTRFWKAISESGKNSPLRRSPFERAMGTWNIDQSPAFQGIDLMTRILSPYQINPSDYHPMQGILEELIDFERIREDTKIHLYISTTNVNTGKVRIFHNHEITAKTLLASACLPFIFKAVEIDGEHYWDGGYMGNPCIFPLIYHSASQDVIVVQINPITRDHVPTTAREILDRANEISFNSSLMREMRAIAFVAHLIDEERLDQQRYKRLNMHMIEAEDELRELGFASKLNVEWEFLIYLRDLGRKTADEWLAVNAEFLGVKSTIDMRDMFV